MREKYYNELSLTANRNIRESEQILKLISDVNGLGKYCEKLQNALKNIVKNIIEVGDIVTLIDRPKQEWNVININDNSDRPLSLSYETGAGSYMYHEVLSIKNGSIREREE